MISLCACAAIGPLPPIDYQRRMGVVAGLKPPKPRHRKERKTINELEQHMESLLKGVTDDGW